MDRTQREQKIRDMLVTIRSDFGKMDDLLNPLIKVGGNAVASRAYLQRQIGKYLKPLTSNGFRTQATKLMTALQIPALLPTTRERYRARNRIGIPKGLAPIT